jgi:hypothetical protein
VPPTVATSTGDRGAAERAPLPPRTRTWAPPRPRLAVAVLTAVVGLVPLAVAAVALWSPHWYPVSDLALIELRVRDVGTADTPLVGPPARVFEFGQRGSHPGPMSFWALAPVYRLLGSSAWALIAATLSLHVAGLGTAIAIAARRGGWRMALGAAAGLALLARAHGAETLAEPWNPYLPIVWWVVFLLTLWSVLCDDLPLLPVAVVAGSFCVQSHISYLGQVTGLGAIVAATTAVSLWRRSHERGDEPSGERSARPRRRRALVWVGLSAVLFGVLWLPVAIEQLTAEPGNLAMLRESVADPAQPPTGLARGAEVWLTGLDLGRLVAGDRSVIGSPLPGLALLAMWALAAAAAMKRSYGPLVRLHAVVAGALALGLVSASRIAGQVIHYLVLWMWGTAILTAAATLWTALVVARRADGRRTSACGLATGLAAVVTVVAAGWLTVDGVGAEQPAPSASRIMGALADDTAEALGSGAVAGGGRGGLYLVRWENVELPPGHANGLLLELERRGLRVGVEADSVLAGDHRVMAPGEATAVVTFVEGPASVARWRDDPAAVEVASAEPSAAAADEFARVRRDTVARLRVDGFHDVADQLAAGNMLALFADPDLPDYLLPLIGRMVDLGLPSAVFITPATH